MALLHSVAVEIASIRHKALRRFAETGDPRGLSADLAPRLRSMLAYIVAISSPEELKAPPNFGAHLLTGDRKGVWSLTVTRNWRLTFRVNEALAVEDMDLEDYH
ncbi:type II toxin-antitoxin system RelE/ParE family toxin [Brevundimonas sp. VNH65]|uniref:type II toxin-antitoxin system RelE/ParE family toxin n=1 Tax=Brevundimonas sp. VNH65 TaxID=3400917 RepID=UPI003BFA9924